MNTVKNNIQKAFFALTLVFALNSNAQSVAINTDGSTADPSAILDLKSTNQGVLVPRLTQSQRTMTSTPATGLMVYQTDATAGFYFYNGTAWTSLNAAGATGAQGPQGIQGEVGPQGPIGPQGPTGPQGIAGTNGTNGSVGATGPQGPIGLTGATGANGQGVPTGGTANQVLAKIDGTNYNTTWVTPASGSGDNLGNHIATQDLNMNNNNITNVNTATTTKLNTSEISIASTATSQINLSVVNATSAQIDATGKTYIRLGSTINDIHIIHGIAGGYDGKILYLGMNVGFTWVNNSSTETVATNRLNSNYITPFPQNTTSGQHLITLMYMSSFLGGRWVVIDSNL